MTLAGATAVPEAELRALLRTREGDLFVGAAVDSDAATLAEQYRRRGYTQVRVEPVSVPEAGNTSPVPVDVRLTVTEGPEPSSAPSPSRADRRRRGGAAGRDHLAYRSALLPAAGRLDRDGMLLVLLNRGYPSAAVDARVVFTQDRSSAAVAFVVSEGPQVFVEHVLVVGNVKTSAEMIRREVTLQPGAPLSYAELTESQRRISALGSSAGSASPSSITASPTGAICWSPWKRRPPPRWATAAASKGVSGCAHRARRRCHRGVRGRAARFCRVRPAESIWPHQSISVFARASLRTRRPRPKWPKARRSQAATPSRLPAARDLSVSAHPRHANDLLVTGFLEQGLRSSFNFTRRGARAELTRRLTRELSFSGRYVIERAKLFEQRLHPEDKPLIDRLFPQCGCRRCRRRSFATPATTRWLPPAGLLGWDNDVAARAIGSEVGFVKIVRAGVLLRRVPGRKATVFAAGARLGLPGFCPARCRSSTRRASPCSAPTASPHPSGDDLPASERFFAGGDTSVRGYALDRLGIPLETINVNGFPTGGNAVFVFNAELRVPVVGGLGAVGFMDAGQVFNRVSDFDFGDIKPTAGLGRAIPVADRADSHRPRVQVRSRTYSPPASRSG